MSKELGEALRAAREDAGLSIKRVADELGISGSAVSQWEAGVTEPNMVNLTKVAHFLNLTIGEVIPLLKQNLESEDPFLRDLAAPLLKPQPKPRPIRSNVRIVEDARLKAETGAGALPPILAPLARDIPIYGTAVGGRGGDFRLNGSEIDRALRPPGLANAKGVFALYLQNDSMYPAWKEGALFFVNPNRKPLPGDDVVIELHGEDDGEPGPAFMKRLLRTSATKYIVQQFNPLLDLEFERSEVRQILRVIPWEEALGLS